MNLSDANHSRCRRSVPAPRRGNLTLILACTHREDFALSDAERELIALPAWLGGLGISTDTHCQSAAGACAQVTAPLVDLINSNAMEYQRGVQQEQKEMKAKVQSRNREKAAKEAEAVKASLTKD